MCVHVEGLAFLFPQAHQMPTVIISTKSGCLIQRKEIIYVEGYIKGICPCFVRESVLFFLILNDFIILQKCSGSNIWDNM